MKNSVVVLTKAELFQKEEFVDVYSSVGALEKYLRTDVSKYIKKDGEGQYHVDNNGATTLYFAHETTIKG